jgi:AraC family transcriptional regulator of adaptative response/methylated-DNA-[protein]-cysteine methyltransferase
MNPDDYERIARAIRFIERNLTNQPGLPELAAELGLSRFHLQKLFLRWAGVTPKRFLQFLTVEYAKHLLAQSHSVLDVSLETGLSSPARLHDHFTTLEAVTPGDYKRQGEGLDIDYGVHPSPFGPMFLATSQRGIVRLAFLTDAADTTAERYALQSVWSRARLTADQAATATIAGRVFDRSDQADAPLPVLVKGSNFQIQVWKALLQIPAGSLCSYEQLARAIARPAACRAVGQALAVNSVGYLIPCHRVIRSLGTVGGYRWGATRKQVLLAWEAAQIQGEADNSVKMTVPAALPRVATPRKSFQTHNP